MIPALINLIVYLLVIGVLVALLMYVNDELFASKPPLHRIIRVVIIVLACLFVILLLLQLIGVGTGVNLPGVAS